jgi:hypothetical protein
MTFDEVLDAVETLTIDEQEELTGIVRRRIIEKRRKQILRDIEDARRELKSGGGRPMSVEDIIREIESPSEH